MEKKPLRRERYPMPGFIRDALAASNVTAAYEARPPYQRNDYIGWISGPSFRPLSRSVSTRCWKSWRRATCT